MQRQVRSCGQGVQEQAHRKRPDSGAILAVCRGARSSDFRPAATGQFLGAARLQQTGGIMVGGEGLLLASSYLLGVSHALPDKEDE